MGLNRKKWIGLALIGALIGWVTSRSRRSVADFETSWGPPTTPPAAPPKDMEETSTPGGATEAESPTEPDPPKPAKATKKTTKEA